MSFEHKPNCGSLFQAQKNSERQPDRQGDAKIVCPSCGHSWISRIAGWMRSGKNGDWLSLSFSEQRQKEPAEKPAPNAPPPSDYEFDDDLPF